MKNEEQKIKHVKNLMAIGYLKGPINEALEKFRQLELIERGHAYWATKYCNGDIEEENLTSQEKRMLVRIKKIIGFIPEGFFFNRDPRGYSLKIRDNIVRERKLQIHRDFGGYGILAPEFQERK